MRAGTLTQNIMGFVWCSIAGQLFGQNSDTTANTPHTISSDAQLLLALQERNTEQHRKVAEFLTHLAVCNTVVPAVGSHGELLYQVCMHPASTESCTDVWYTYSQILHSTLQQLQQLQIPVLHFRVVYSSCLSPFRNPMGTSLLIHCFSWASRCHVIAPVGVWGTNISALQPRYATSIQIVGIPHCSCLSLTLILAFHTVAAHL